MKSEAVIERGIYLRVLRKLFIVPLCMVICAALLFGAYSLWIRLTHQRTFEQVSKLYIEFAGSHEDNVRDYYNGATWTDLLTAHPMLLSGIRDGLGGMEEEAAKALVRRTVRAEILSDIRLMTLTVDAEDAALAEQLTEAVSGSLVRFGTDSDKFRSIELLSTDPVREVMIDDRSRNAALLGAFLGLAFSAAYLWFREAVRLAVYTPEEAEHMYGVPCAGLIPAAGTDPERMSAELSKLSGNLAADAGDEGGRTAVVSVRGKQTAEAVCGRLGEGFRAADTAEDPALKECGRILVVLGSGRDEGAAVSRLLSELRIREAGSRILTVLADADCRLIDRYYRI